MIVQGVSRVPTARLVDKREIMTAVAHAWKVGNAHVSSTLGTLNIALIAVERPLLRACYLRLGSNSVGRARFTAAS